MSKQIVEGRRKINSDLNFNYPAGKQTQTEKNVVKGTVKQTETPIPSCVTDSLSAIFYAASQRLAQSYGWSDHTGRSGARNRPLKSLETEARI